MTGELSLNPEQVAILVEAYEAACKQLGLGDRRNPLADMLARRILHIAEIGVSNPHSLCRRALLELDASGQLAELSSLDPVGG